MLGAVRLAWGGIVGGLPRPDIPPGNQRDLVDALHDLHHRAGWPSLRSLAASAGCSHTTVSTVFSSPRLPSWGILELLVEAMDGDVQMFHDLWLAASAPSGSSGQSPCIAGRRSELGIVRRHMTRPGLLLVSGEAGIGKTHLVSGATSASDLVVATGHCLPLSASTPLAPVAEALQSLFAGHSNLVRDAMSAGPSFVRPSLARLLPTLADDELKATPEDSWARQRLFAAVAFLLEELQQPDPVPLVIEDLHWADTSTLEFLEHFVARGSTVPMIGTWRSGDPTLAPASRDWRLRVNRMAGVSDLELGPLSREETREQLTLLDGHEPDQSYLETIFTRAQGQPLFVEQLASQHGSSDGSLPALLAEVLDAQLGQLGGPAWRVARALGLASRALDTALLATVSELPTSELTSALHDLAHRRLLAPEGGRDVALRHPLLADAIRGRLVGGEAAAVHERLAVALAERSDPEPEEVAHHFAQAGCPEAELTWRIRAARQAQRRFAPREELDAWQRVLELWPADSLEAGTPPVMLGEVHARVLDCAVVVAPVEAVARLTDEALERDLPLDQRLHILRRAGDVKSAVGDTAHGLALLDEAVRMYAGRAPAADYVDTLECRCHILSGEGRFTEAAADASTALEVAERIPDLPRMRRMLGETAVFLSEAGRAKEALQVLEDARAIRLAAENPVEDVKLALSEVAVLRRTGAPADRVLTAATTGLDLASRWGYESFLTSYLRYSAAEALLWEGMVDRAGALVDPVTTDEVSVRIASAHVARAAVDLCRGLVPEALDRCAALDAVKEGDSGNWAAYAVFQSEVELWSGSPESARTRLEEALSFLLATEAAVDAAPIAVAFARAEADRLESVEASAAERSTAVAALMARLKAAKVDPFGSAATDVATPAYASTMRAEVARMAGSATDELWADATSHWDRLARPHLAAYCRWRAAQVAAAMGKGSIAARLLKRAARESRTHVPLHAAITSTAGSAAGPAVTRTRRL
jgi:hypothetical protein